MKFLPTTSGKMSFPAFKISAFLIRSAALLLLTLLFTRLDAAGDGLNIPVDQLRGPALDIQQLRLFNSSQNENVVEQTSSLQFFPDSVLVYSTQSNLQRFDYIFSPNGELLTMLLRIRQGATWVNQSIENRTYDAAGNMTNQLYLAWNGNAWVNTSRNIFTYNDNRKLLTHTEQIWNSSTSSWTDFRKTTNTWSASGLQLSMLQEVFSGGIWVNQTYEFYNWQENKLIQAERQVWTNGNWANENQHLYTYDAQGNLLTMTMKQWTGNQWSDFYREVFSYNVSNQLTIYVSQLFNNSWQNSEQYFYTYDVLGFPETVIRQVWQGSTWQNSLRRSYSNNNYGTAQLAVFEIWQQGTWVSQNMFTKAIDDYGNVTSSNAYTWNNSWQQNQDNQLEVNYNYGLKTLRFQGYRAEAGFTSMLVGVREKPGTASTKVYPNPANGKLFIINTLLSSDPLDIHIFATDGRKVTELRQPAEPFITLDLEKSGLREGSYIMKISSPEGTSTHRITYLK